MVDSLSFHLQDPKFYGLFLGLNKEDLQNFTKKFQIVSDTRGFENRNFPKNYPSNILIKSLIFIEKT